MIKLQKYEDFIERVNELGFMAFANVLPGFPSLTGETPGRNWHTGDPDTDPWRWKDRAAEEKKLAFGCVLGGNKGFIAPRMYSIFYTACRQEEHMEELHDFGLISPEVWRLWQLFETRSPLSTSEIRREMGVTKKNGGSRVDKAISVLEQVFYITVAGSRRKIDKFGKPYSWFVNVYDKVENWAPKEWLEPGQSLSREDARNIILEQGLAISENVNRDRLVRMLKF